MLETFLKTEWLAAGLSVWIEASGIGWWVFSPQEENKQPWEGRESNPHTQEGYPSELIPPTEAEGGPRHSDNLVLRHIKQQPPKIVKQGQYRTCNYRHRWKHRLLFTAPPFNSTFLSSLRNYLTSELLTEEKKGYCVTAQRLVPQQEIKIYWKAILDNRLKNRTRWRCGAITRSTQYSYKT